MNCENPAVGRPWFVLRTEEFVQERKQRQALQSQLDNLNKEHATAQAEWARVQAAHHLMIKKLQEELSGMRAELVQAVADKAVAEQILQRDRM